MLAELAASGVDARRVALDEQLFLPAMQRAPPMPVGSSGSPARGKRERWHKDLANLPVLTFEDEAELLAQQANIALLLQRTQQRDAVRGGAWPRPEHRSFEAARLLPSDATAATS